MTQDVCNDCAPKGGTQPGCPTCLSLRREVLIVERLVLDGLALGYSISVDDGEAWPVKRSRDMLEITRALMTTDSDRLRFRRPDGSLVGDVFMVWGNGHECLSDHTDNPDTHALVTGAETVAEVITP
jgi:hypothetical protein